MALDKDFGKADTLAGPGETWPEGDDCDLEALGLLGRAPAFTAAMKQLQRFAGTSAHVLIQGETGTGKELVARAVHYLSQRRYKPFVPVNCGALPDTLVENELFGHARGAFTDAREAQPGLVADADGGTLFLDEIECLSPKAQVSLLRFLQDGVYRPLGARTNQYADARVIAASNRDFDEMVADGSFRQDLLYRLAIMSVELPPLRDRGADVLLLVNHFLRRYARKYGRPVPRLDEASLPGLMSHGWPGNIRELENVVHRELLLGSGDVVRIDLNPERGGCRAHVTPNDRVADRTRLVCMDMKDAKAEVIARFERHYLEHVIAESHGNVSLAAQRAGKERRAFGKLLKKYGIDREQY